MDGVYSELVGQLAQASEVRVGLEVGLQDLDSGRVDAQNRPGRVDRL